MMSDCTVPYWNLKHQRQEQLRVGEERNRSSHVQFPYTYHHPIMSNYQVAELTWEHGQPTMQPTQPTVPTKPTWGCSDTLESIVQQATCQKTNQLTVLPDHAPKNVIFLSEAISDGQADKYSGPKRLQPLAGRVNKRTRSDSEQCGAKYRSNNVKEEGLDHSMCASASASASATVCREDDTTMMTWASFESLRSLRTKTSEDDSESHGGSENRDEDRETKDETGHSSLSTRRSRAAAVHNLSERRRRDRINQKMKALQMLVPNASKTDKASMLDEVIEYLKQLQAQVNMMSYRSMPQMVVPLGISPQQLHMSMLSRMQGVGVGLGMGMGMFDVNALARATPQTMTSPLMHPTSVAAASTSLVSPHFMVPAMIPTPSPSTSNSDSGTSASLPVPDPYCAFLAQKMNMDLYSKMAALYGQQFRPTSQATSGATQSSRVLRD